MAGTKQKMAPMWKKLLNNVAPDEPTSFLDHVYLGWTQLDCKNRTKSLVSTTKKCLNHVFLLGQLKNYQGGKKT